LILTEYWTESITIEPAKLFDILKERIFTKEIKVDFKTTVELIESYVKDLNSIVYQIKEEKLISEVVNKLDLFSSIGEIKDKKTAENQVMNLASYLLFNQLLFYHIYKKKAEKDSLPEFEEIQKVQDLQKYFNEITKIDYQSIYKVNILGHIPDKKIVIDTLNEVIKAIKLLRAEHITHDLAGRFFHDLIPYEVRKVLAAFYTHPVAAEILACLTIDSYDETVIDPACGSGTLLVSAYRRKKDLYQKLFGFKEQRLMHKKFIEKDLTGSDIMPFAAHISAINLTMQNIQQRTNTIRIATLDSLEMEDLLRTTQFKRKGLKITPYTTTIQSTLFEAYSKPKKIKKKGSISAEGRGSEFFIKPTDVVIMNPPFSDREKMPSEYREKLKTYHKLNEKSGNQVNLWGYFLSLADDLIVKNGKIGAVIPINIAKGKATEKIRNYLFENYTLKYLIKPTKDIAFSENATFRDVLFIVEKKKPTRSDYSKIVFLKKSIKDLTLENAQTIAAKIKENDVLKKEIYKDDEIEMFSISSITLNEQRENLMSLISGDSITFREDINKFLDFFEKKSIRKIIKIDEKWLREGYGPRPKGTSDLIIITRPLGKNRIERASLILKSENNDKVEIQRKGTEINFEVSKQNIVKSLRSITNVNRFDITSNEDIIINKNFPAFDKIKLLSKFEKDAFNWIKLRNELDRIGRTRTILPDKIDLTSPNTHLLCIFSENMMIPTNMFYLFNYAKTEDESKIITLYMNSIMLLSQFLINTSRLGGPYVRLKKEDWKKIKIIDLKELALQDIELLLNLFKRLRKIEFPSIIDQLENRFTARVELDSTLLKIFGFSEKEINEWLPRIYDSIATELKAMKQVR